jgi:hypothetical protein
MAKTERETADVLRNKLTKRDGGSEVTSALLTGFMLFVVMVGATQTNGLVASGLWFVAELQILGILVRIAGWRTVSLNNDEQEFLKKNYKL